MIYELGRFLATQTTVHSFPVSSLKGPVSAQVSRSSGFNLQPSLCDICIGHSGTGTGFPCDYFRLSTCQRHSTYAPYPCFRLSPTLFNLISYSIVKQTL